MNVEIAPGRYGGHDVDVVTRASDWGLDGARKYLHHAREAIRLLQQAQEYDALVVFTVGIEAFLLGKLRGLFCPKTRFVVADFLIPRAGRLVDLVSDGLKQIDAFVCIRKGDIKTLQRRLRVPPSKCMFAPFPSNRAVMDVATSEGGYIYSAGWAHRDWPTLIRALMQVDCEAILSVGGNVDVPEPIRARVHVLQQRSPEEGRCLMAHASLVILPLSETELPSGPIVLLDAMAMGKAVIVSDVNGSRDYVVHGRTALLVAPGDHETLATAIRELLENDELRRNLGLAARGDVGRRFITKRFVEKAIEACTCTTGPLSS